MQRPKLVETYVKGRWVWKGRNSFHLKKLVLSHSHRQAWSSLVGKWLRTSHCHCCGMDVIPDLGPSVSRGQPKSEKRGEESIDKALERALEICEL